MKLGKDTASVVNWMIGNGGVPVVGEGATILHWTDRHAYTVVSVSDDKKKVTIRRDKATRTDTFGMSDAQSYQYEPDENGATVELVLRRGKWRYKCSDGSWAAENVRFGIRQEYYDYSF